MVKTKHIVALFLVSFNFGLFAQDFNIFLLSQTTWDSSRNNQLILQIDNSNFFKNNEYMGDFKQGYTAPGYIFRPCLSYFPGTRTKISAGLHLIHLFGEEGFYEIKPSFRIHHILFPQLHLVMGELYGNLNHRLIEPVYEFDRYFFDHQEEGIQVFIKTGILTGDLWLDWENFIYWRDKDQEEGTLGFSGEVHFFRENENFQIDIPLQGIICHRGGQINDTELSNQSITNLVPGIHFNYYPKSFFECISIQGHYVYFNDFSIQWDEGFRDGYGIYPSVVVNTRLFDFQSAYWYAFNYYGPRGEPLFFSPSSYRFYFDLYRNLLVNKIGFSKDCGHGIEVGLFADTFFDIDHFVLDYNYGIYLRFNQDFFIKKVKPLKY